MMSTPLRFCLISATLLCNFVFAGEFKFKSVDVPGSRSTQAFGINDHGAIVGTYIAADGTAHGYLQHRGSITNIDAPGAFVSNAFGINDHGTITGTSAVPPFGWVEDKEGNFTDVPCCPFAINNLNQLVGSFADSSFNIHGFLDTNGNRVTISDPSGPNFTVPSGVNDHDQIVGKYRVTGSATDHGFLLSEGVFTTIDVPGAISTNANGINGRGEIVGIYIDNNNVQHGFLLVDGAFITIDFPGASSTQLTGINRRGEIVGFSLSPGTHSFVARRGSEN
jgi:hypothetical protein